MDAADALKDHSGQDVPAGVYTLRRGTLPPADDRSKASDFAYLCPAGDDVKPDTLDEKAVQELSAKATGKEAGGFVLADASRDATDSPRFLGAKAKDKEKATGKEAAGKWVWVLYGKLSAKAGGEPTKVPIGLTLIEKKDSPAR